jgi:hypothetical protein
MKLLGTLRYKLGIIPEMPEEIVTNFLVAKRSP